MREEPFFFSNGTSELFGVMHESSPAEARLPFVFCHPFGEEKLWTHRAFVTFARELARRGHPVLRFDYMGNGDSSGDFSESSIETALSDIGCAIDVLKRRVAAREVGLLGLRFGATLAAQIADSRTDVQRLALWSPIANGDRYMQDLLRINLTTQMAVYKEIRQERTGLVEDLRAGRTANVDGYEMSLPMFEQASAINLTAAPRAFTGRCLIVQTDRSPVAQPSAESKLLLSRYSNASLELAQEEPFWKEIERFYDTAPNLFSKTLEWLAAE